MLCCVVCVCVCVCVCTRARAQTMTVWDLHTLSPPLGAQTVVCSWPNLLQPQLVPIPSTCIIIMYYNYSYQSISHALPENRILLLPVSTDCPEVSICCFLLCVLKLFLMHSFRFQSRKRYLPVHSRSQLRLKLDKFVTCSLL